MCPQVIGIDDVERLLGERPFTSAEMRNIDRYRRGAGSGVEPPASPSSGDSEPGSSKEEAKAGEEKPPKPQDVEGSPPKGGPHPRVESGVTVAT